jgi:VanZ family protein
LTGAVAKAFSPLPLYLAGAYTLLAIYGSLYPFADWHDSGAPLTAFLSADWPRYTTTFDIASNIGAYLPLGFLWVAALRQRLPVVFAVFVSVIIGASLSFSMEVLQHFLPSRVPSVVDFGCNAAGTLIGAVMGGSWGRTMVDGGWLDNLRRRLFVAGTMPDAGLLLIWLWLLTQLNPDTLLFGNGSLRQLLDIPAPLDYSAGNFIRIEAVIVGTETLAIALMVTSLARSSLPSLALAVIAAGLAAKSFAFLLMMSGSAGFAWATPGSLGGLAVGLMVWFFATPLQPRWQRALAALSLLVATTLVNIAPENPYLENTFQLWNPGQFLNFHGLTRLASNLWPFLALPWLMLMKTDHER